MRRGRLAPTGLLALALLCAGPVPARADRPPGSASAASPVLPASAASANAASSPLCRALRACIDGGALCVLVQVPARQRQRVLASEAYADMESRLAALRARRPQLHLVVQPQDLARSLGGVRPAAELRTLWVSSQGRALLWPGLFVDDTTPVEQYFHEQRLPEVMQGHAQALTVRRRPGAC